MAMHYTASFKATYSRPSSEVDQSFQVVMTACLLADIRYASCMHSLDEVRVFTAGQLHTASRRAACRGSRTSQSYKQLSIHHLNLLGPVSFPSKLKLAVAAAAAAAAALQVISCHCTNCHAE